MTRGESGLLYITTGAGANQQDSDRNTENAATYTLGVGKFINPRWSVDAELNYQNPKLNPNEDLNWSQYGISVDARRHWRQSSPRPAKARWSAAMTASGVVARAPMSWRRRSS